MLSGLFMCKLAPDFRGGTVPVLGHHPARVVGFDELLDCLTKRRNGVELTDPEQLFLECFEKPFDDTVTLGLSNIRW
jgi:hypothetical protein